MGMTSVFLVLPTLALLGCGERYAAAPSPTLPEPAAGAPEAPDRDTGVSIPVSWHYQDDVLTFFRPARSEAGGQDPVAGVDFPAGA